MNSTQYIEQVRLLLSCLPALQNQDVFALKGGTAINFFIQDLPRLSVDIDLTYIKENTRNQAIKEIQEGLRDLGKKITSYDSSYQIKELLTADGLLKKIIVKSKRAQIKIEPNFIMRCSLLPTILMSLKKEVESAFKYSVNSIPVLNEAELYAGKICAALSRQHPRDFFDVKKLFEAQGLTKEIRQAFVVYLVCSPRPISELLRPNQINLKNTYETEFVNMTDEPVSLEELMFVRDKLIKTVNQDLTGNEKEFLLSLKNGTPNYTLLPFNNLASLPALQWKLANIQKMAKQKHQDRLEKLKAVLEI